MKLSLRRHESFRTAIKRNAHRHITRALEFLDAERDGDFSDRIHEARKHLKHARALVHLVGRGTGHKDWAHTDRKLRRVTRALSGIRDATELRETLLRLEPRARLQPATLALFQSTLAYRLNRAYEDTLAHPGRHKRLQETLHSARREILSSTGIASGWEAIGPGLRAIYEDARTAASATASRSARDDKSLHATRKRAKDLLHVLEFLRGIDPEGIGERIQGVHQLTDLLGEDHDLAVMQTLLEGPLQRYMGKVELQRLARVVAARRQRLQQRASVLSKTLYTDDPGVFVKRVHLGWGEWRAHKKDAARRGCAPKRPHSVAWPARE